MNLNVSEWKPFVTSRLFPVMEVGKASQQMLEEGNDCFYVGAKKNDNGVMVHCRYDESLISKGNCIVFICNGQGSVGFANYMDVDFIGTTDIIAGYSEHLNELNGLFLATVYSQERPKYSFGRKWKTHLKDTEIKLPALHNADGTIFIDKTFRYSDEGYVPDWQFMEDYIKSLHYKPLATKNKANQAPDLNIDSWKPFRIDSMFDIYTGGDLIMGDIDDGDIPIASNSSENNNIAAYTDVIPGRKLFDHTKSISVADRGRFWVFIQPRDFYLATRAKGLVCRDANILNKYQMAFIATLINQESFKFSYGRNCCANLNDMEISLPVQHDTDGTPIIDNTHMYSDEGYIPDWHFMEKYIKALPYGDRL